MRLAVGSGIYWDKDATYLHRRVNEVPIFPLSHWHIHTE